MTIEELCPRCGCGMETGWQYASCAEYPAGENQKAHEALCAHFRFARDLCDTCHEEVAS